MHDFWSNQNDAGRCCRKGRSDPQTAGFPGVSSQVTLGSKDLGAKWPRDAAWKSIQTPVGCDWFGNQSEPPSQAHFVAFANKEVSTRGACDCVTGSSCKVLETLL